MARCRSALFLLLSFLTLSSYASEDQRECTYTAKDGKYYDLSPLSSKTDYTIRQENGKNEIILNVCKPVVHETWNIGGGNEALVGGYTRRERGDFSIGQANTTFTTGSAPKTLKMVMNNGSPCSSSTVKASTAIEFVCDNRIYGVGQPRLVAQLPEDEACAYWIEWRTTYACPTNPPSTFSFFRFLFYTTLSLVIIYLALGTLYNRFVLDLRGYEQVPKFSVEAVKWHVREGLAWVRGYDSQSWQVNPVSHQHRVAEEGVGGFVRGGLPTRRGGLGGEINPVSDHAQMQSQVQPPVVEEGRGGFVRPESGGTPRGGLGGEINPVSDHAQMQSQLQSQSRSSPAPHPSQQAPSPSTQPPQPVQPATTMTQPPQASASTPPPPAPPAKEQDASFAIEEEEESDSGSGSGEEEDSDEDDEDEDEAPSAPAKGMGGDGVIKL